MKRLTIYTRNNKIYLYDGEKVEIISDMNKYREVINNSNTGKYGLFDKIINEFHVTDIDAIKDNFLYIFNFILINNVANYIIDRFINEDFNELTFDKSIKENYKQIIKLSGTLDVNDMIGDVIISLINSDEYLSGKVKIDYGFAKPKNKNFVYEDKGLEYFFNYRTKDIENLKEQLKIDLIAFNFVSTNELTKDGRFILPIYVDEESLISKAIENYEDYLINWQSIAYLKMISKIHDYFIDYYKIDSKKGLENDNLTLALIDLLDSDIKPYPMGLEKSIEVGRETSGKCFFINGIVAPISLPQELALILQSKDAFSVVPKVFRSNR